MSIELGKLHKTGSRKIDLDVTRYWGGDDVGLCIQITGEQEEGGYGYVQLSANDIVALLPMFKDIITAEIERRKALLEEYLKGEADQLSAFVDDLRKVHDWFLEAFEVPRILIFSTPDKWTPEE